MNKKYFFTSIFLSTGIIVLALVINYAAAQSEIQYPVKELGNCANEAACRTYCDKSSNTETCLNFAEQHNLMSTQEIETARKFLEAGPGPGGCKTKDACETYCDSVSHIDECVAYAEKNGLMSPQDLEEAKKVQAAKARGVKMPACGGKKQCDAYCSEPEHMEECITFAQEAGFMSAQELEDSKKVLAAIKAGAKPPPCKGKAECDVYCMEEEHFDSCLNFALAAGMMDPKDAEMAKKTKGKGPGGCRGKEQCDAFCQQDQNMETCAQFAYENGMMTKEEFEMMKKTGGKGPGGCKSKEECQNFCDNPDNQETCFNFAKENGMIPQEDLQRMEQVKQQFKEMLQNAPAEVYSCLESIVGAEMMTKLKSGGVMPPKDMGDKMGSCFQQNIRPRGVGGPGEGGSMPPAGGSGGSMPPDGSGLINNGGALGPEQMIQLLSSPKFMECAQSLLPPSVLNQIFMSGGQIGPDIMEKIRPCLEQPLPGVHNTLENANNLIIFNGVCRDAQPCFISADSNMNAPVLQGFEGPGACKSYIECKEFCLHNIGRLGCPPIQPRTDEYCREHGGDATGCSDYCSRFRNAPPPGCSNWPHSYSSSSGGASLFAPGSVPASGSAPVPCEGSNCPPPPPAPGTPGSAPAGAPGTYNPPAGINPPATQQPPPSTAPGGGGSLPPGEYVPPAPPSGETTPPPSSPPTSFLNSLLGLIIYPFKLLFR